MLFGVICSRCEHCAENLKDKPPTVPLSEAVAHSINASEALQDTTGRRRDGPGWICENCLKMFEGVGFDQIFSRWHIEVKTCCLW